MTNHLPGEAFALLDELVELTTNLGETDQDFVEARTLALLDNLVVALYQVSPSADFVDTSPEPVDRQALRQVIAERFPRWATYNTVMDVTTEVGYTELALGDAVEDLTDIIAELMLVRSAHSQLSLSQAQWLLLDGYYNFWRGPLRSLQLFIHYLEAEVDD